MSGRLIDVIVRGSRASQPALPSSDAVPGSLYYVTDEALTERVSDDGATWQDFTDGASGGTKVIGLTIDGGGNTITTGIKADISIPFACTITGVRMLADQSGSMVVDIWKDTYANYPPTVADTITAAAKPTITAATKSQDTTLTGWVTAIAAGDTLRFNVDSASTVTRVNLTLTATI